MYFFCSGFFDELIDDRLICVIGYVGVDCRISIISQEPSAVWMTCLVASSHHQLAQSGVMYFFCSGFFDELIDDRLICVIGYVGVDLPNIHYFLRSLLLYG